MTHGSDWAGRVGDVWGAEWRRTDRSFADLASRLDATIAAVVPNGARVIDIGCGAGTTARALAVARGDVEVLGVDLSHALLDAARARPGLPNLRYEQGDAIAIARAIAADLYISRHGVMFFDDPAAAFAALGAAARGNARIVFSCFAERRANRWAAEPIAALGGDSGAATGTASGPFAFADPDRVAALLARAGWRSDPPQRVAFRYVAGAGADPVGDAVDFLRRIGPAAPLLRDKPPSARAAMVARLRETCMARLDGDEVAFPAAAWIWSARCADRGSQI